MRIEAPLVSPFRRSFGESGMPASDSGVSTLPDPLDVFEQGDHALCGVPGCTVPAPRMAERVAWSSGASKRVVSGGRAEVAREGPSDPSLLTAGRWAPVRVRSFPTSDPVLREALRHLGLRYVWQGADLRRGVDCSGFAWNVYRRCGRHVPLQWFRDGSADPRADARRFERDGMRHVESPRPGDIVVFGRQHVGIYAGEVNGKGLYVGANHGGRQTRGRVDIMPVDGYNGVRPVYFRYAPRKMRAASPGIRS